MICILGCSGGPYEKELLNDLFKNYNVQNRPVLNESSPIVITFGVTLQQIVDLVGLEYYSICAAACFSLQTDCVLIFYQAR